MIRLQLKGIPGNIKGFAIWGHARFADHGMDIVCAGVSAVVGAAIIGMIKRAPGKVQYRLLPKGYIQCRIAEDLSKSAARDVQVILDTMVYGLMSIRNSYKDRINIAYRR